MVEIISGFMVSIERPAQQGSHFSVYVYWKTCREKPPVFVEFGVTYLPQSLMFVKLGGHCFSSLVDVNKQRLIPPARNDVRVMTLCPASLWCAFLSMFFCGLQNMDLTQNILWILVHSKPKNQFRIQRN